MSIVESKQGKVMRIEIALIDSGHLFHLTIDISNMYISYIFLEITIFTANSMDIQELEKDVECLICLQLLDDPRLLPCSHTLCYNCIRAAVDSNGTFKCPLKDGTTVPQHQINKLPLNRAIQNIVEFVKNKNPVSRPDVAVPRPVFNSEHQLSTVENKEILNLSVLQGREKIHNFNSAAHGYQFRLYKPMKLLSVEVKVDVDGPVAVFVTNIECKVIQKSTIQSSAGMKWVKIPIVVELKNKYNILVHSPVQFATFAFKHVHTLDPRPINEICSVACCRTMKLEEDEDFNKLLVHYNTCRSIEMRIEIER